jgi:hypothetical protein
MSTFTCAVILFFFRGFVKYRIPQSGRKDKSLIKLSRDESADSDEALLHLHLRPAKRDSVIDYNLFVVGEEINLFFTTLQINYNLFVVGEGEGR